GGAYHLGPPSDFKKELTISFTLDGYDLTEKDKSLFSIYRYEKNGWEKQESFLYENSICAKVRSLGIFRLVYDAEQEHITGIPRTYQLFQNYPNPFNPQTMIKYDLPNPGHVNVTIYNILGQKVKTLVNEHQEAGHKWVNWDGKDDGGKEVASGIYFYKIKTAEFEKTKKMVLLK
ncbi:MAG: T9SS type A sorting domain-containing protein, partial [Candidatus Zixiibacteriota bacterium]